jgi:hypothetical protein
MEKSRTLPLNKVKKNCFEQTLASSSILIENFSSGYGFVDFESQEEAQRVFDLASAEEVSFSLLILHLN